MKECALNVAKQATVKNRNVLLVQVLYFQQKTLDKNDVFLLI